MTTTPWLSNRGWGTGIPAACISRRRTHERGRRGRQAALLKVERSRFTIQAWVWRLALGQNTWSSQKATVRFKPYFENTYVDSCFEGQGPWKTIFQFRTRNDLQGFSSACTKPRGGSKVDQPQLWYPTAARWATTKTHWDQGYPCWFALKRRCPPHGWKFQGEDMIQLKKFKVVSLNCQKPIIKLIARRRTSACFSHSSPSAVDMAPQKARVWF